MGAFISMLIIVGVVVTVAAMKSGGNSADPIWRAAAQRLGLQFERTDMMNSPKISGTRRGLSVRIDTYSKSGDDNRTYTRYKVNFKRSLGLGLRLIAQGPSAYISRKLGAQDIVTGDQDFDDAVIVKGRDPEKVKEFLNSARRLRTVRFLTLYPGATIHDSGIECEERDLARSPDRIVQIVQRMTTLAEKLAEDDDANLDYVAATASHDEVRADSHSILLLEAPEQDPLSLDTLSALESDSESIGYELPAIADQADSYTRSEPEHTDLDERIPEESETAEPASSVDPPLDARTVVEELYGQGRTTSQTADIFDSRYKDRSVAWSGTILNVRSYRFDLVFGDVPGTRVEFEVFGTADLPAGGRAVRAVVRFPVEAEERLRALVDRRVVFFGNLISCDAFMRILFLADGQLSEEDA